MSEIIVGVAIRWGDRFDSLPAPSRHNDVIAKLRLILTRKELEDRPHLSLGEQGFETNCGRFLTRAEARILALENGQCPKPMHARDLFSEDLW